MANLSNLNPKPNYDRWYHEGEPVSKPAPAPGSWNDVDPNQNEGVGGCLYIGAVTSALIVIAVVAMLMAVYWH